VNVVFVVVDDAVMVVGVEDSDEVVDEMVYVDVTVAVSVVVEMVVVTVTVVVDVPVIGVLVVLGGVPKTVMAHQGTVHSIVSIEALPIHKACWPAVRYTGGVSISVFSSGSCAARSCVNEEGSASHLTKDASFHCVAPHRTRVV
jgi:hypothetical protein